MSNITITLERYCYAPVATLGRLRLQNQVWYTIERPWANNQKEISCIPEGLYLCKPYESRKFGKTYEITGVPERSYVLFHSANLASELKGCIALGKMPDDKEFRIHNSKVAMQEFLNAVKGFEQFNLHVTQYHIEHH